MPTDSTGLRRWTERFAVTSAASLVLAVASAGPAGETRLPALVALFGFVCPMIFGMAYLLVPPYVGRTVRDHRLPGVHFGLAYGGAVLLVLGWVHDGVGTLFAIGAVAWALGVAVFLGVLVATVAAAIQQNRASVFARGDRPQRSTRLATAMIPVALSYLAVGTGILLLVTWVETPGSWTLSQVLHFYAAGFGALLVFSLSARLLIGFYHVSLPRFTVWVVLLAGASAPPLVTVTMWNDPWFPAGGVLESGAMVGYLAVVALVGRRTDRRRFGLLAIVLGAVAGVAAVLVAAPLAVGMTVVERAVTLHRTLVLWGFFPLTIVGYAVLFFPVTEGQFPGATGRGVTTTVLLLGSGLLVRVIGLAAAAESLRLLGVLVSTLGALGYAYLLTRRFYG